MVNKSKYFYLFFNTLKTNDLSKGFIFIYIVNLPITSSHPGACNSSLIKLAPTSFEPICNPIPFANVSSMFPEECNFHSQRCPF